MGLLQSVFSDYVLLRCSTSPRWAPSSSLCHGQRNTRAGSPWPVLLTWDRLLLACIVQQTPKLPGRYAVGMHHLADKRVTENVFDCQFGFEHCRLLHLKDLWTTEITWRCQKQAQTKAIYSIRLRRVTIAPGVYQDVERVSTAVETRTAMKMPDHSARHDFGCKIRDSMTSDESAYSSRVSIEFASRIYKTLTTGNFDKTGDDPWLPDMRPRLDVQFRHAVLSRAAKPLAHGRVAPVSHRNPGNMDNRVVYHRGSRRLRSRTGLV
jgi:hypothetical protein